ncbi:hypothetical protein [Mucilaginibacter arboris]|uniref:Uncharacterized protein n=1 Tax=Mucilaginibacter arboris TaxID=2682090 RepID=A0A7K1SWW5_9SPHI|nr:hypothetical protein [Mucilaginibacter arboris]MVN21825.1 hypothetical protein [Mucilaginibacter arboris]
MKKRLLPIMTLFGLWHNVTAQPHIGLQQYYYMGIYKTFTIVPIATYQSSKNWYAEGRYNYEAVNTLSLYGGKTFEKKAAVSYSASPILGVVLGQMNGGSAGINLEMDYRKFNFNTQTQFTFSVQQLTNNFIYSWSDLTYQFLEKFSAGVSLQQTKLYQVNGAFEKGFLIKTGIKNWNFPLYVFRPESNERYFVLGINYDWQQKNSAKNSTGQL